MNKFIPNIFKFVSIMCMQITQWHADIFTGKIKDKDRSNQTDVTEFPVIKQYCDHTEKCSSVMQLKLKCIPVHKIQ